jgi:hypothetical protein
VGGRGGFRALTVAERDRTQTEARLKQVWGERGCGRQGIWACTNAEPWAGKGRLQALAVAEREQTQAAAIIKQAIIMQALPFLFAPSGKSQLSTLLAPDARCRKTPRALSRCCAWLYPKPSRFASY